MRPALEAFRNRFGTKPVVALEIGVAAGKNAQEIHDNLRCKRLYLVDNWHSKYRKIVFKWMEEACRRFEDDKRVVIIKASSLDAWRLLERERFDFIYVDGNHSRDHVMQELAIYWRLLAPGGMIAGHDYKPELKGRVADAVHDWAAPQYLHLNSKNLDWWIWK